MMAGATRAVDSSELHCRHHMHFSICTGLLMQGFAIGDTAEASWTFHATCNLGPIKASLMTTDNHKITCTP